MDDLEIIECIVGDTSDIIELGVQTSERGRRPVVLVAMDANFSCKIAVPGAAPPINRAVTDKTVDNFYFRGWLTPTETLAIGPGDFLLGMQISNAALTPPMVKEKQWLLRMIPQAAT